MKNKKKVLFLCGGKSQEHEISLISAKGVLEALDRTKFDPILVGISKEGVWHLEKEHSYFVGEFRADLIKLNTRAPKVFVAPYLSEKKQGHLLTETGDKISFDVVFPILHGPFGEDGTIQGFLELSGIPFVGSGCESSAVCMDKALTKVILQKHQIPVVDFEILYQSADWITNQASIKRLGLPLFVKPTRQGSSYGVSKVTSWEELEKAIDYALEFDKKCLIEKGMVGREIECAVLGPNRKARVALPGEIVPHPSIGWYSFEAKYLLKEGAKVVVPTHLTKEQIETVQNLALEAYKILECEGFARIDFFLEAATGNWYLNEVNTIPGFTPISMFPKMWEVSGIPYSSLVTELIELGLSKR